MSVTLDRSRPPFTQRPAVWNLTRLYHGYFCLVIPWRRQPQPLAIPTHGAFGRPFGPRAAPAARRAQSSPRGGYHDLDLPKPGRRVSLRPWRGRGSAPSAPTRPRPCSSREGGISASQILALNILVLSLPAAASGVDLGQNILGLLINRGRGLVFGHMAADKRCRHGRRRLQWWWHRHALRWSYGPSLFQNQMLGAPYSFSVCARDDWRSPLSASEQGLISPPEAKGAGQRRRPQRAGLGPAALVRSAPALAPCVPIV